MLGHPVGRDVVLLRLGLLLLLAEPHLLVVARVVVDQPAAEDGGPLQVGRNTRGGLFTGSGTGRARGGATCRFFGVINSWEPAL